MKDPSDDPKQQAILKSAWEAFATYGFRKTSMDDIARGAGISRPALYLRYKNKEDIFRRLSQHYYDAAAEDVARALADAGSVSQRLARAFGAQSGPLIEKLLSSPHGIELLDASKTAAPDIADAGEARLRGIYAEWLKRERAAGRALLSGEPEDVAAAITSALKGLKSGAVAPDSYGRNVAQLAAMIGRGLEAG